MSTRSAGLDETVARLSEGARHWIGRHARYLDSPAAHTELPVTPRVKALLQLALLRRCWGEAAPADAALTEVASVVEQAWQRVDFAHLLTLDRRYARQFELMYAALTPAGAVTDEPRTVLARLTADGYLAPRRKPPYLHLEARYYADLAGADHRFASYEDLYAASLLARATTLPVADLDVCVVTHTVFYLSDFGFRAPALTDEERGRALRVVERLTDHCVGLGEWDLVGKLVLAQFCLGADPLVTASGAAGLRMLARVQSADGAIPGRSVIKRAAADATPVDFFRKSYQTTVVTALATLIVTSGRAEALCAAGASTLREAP
ncbi:hypothetical protein F0344_32860 [Streptomyces finlayi]|uniref:DUF6895 domain-containing protein n=1 Tax=Streptomyces finlayi TaxID=67296 RepID=A0A7G7BTU3_9ACTN|nr:hypothetical protein [Streptomyces finlayi]QNE78758.1 hypothetical protein F0344_32860 [Streptomyces finlayi]